MAYISVFWKPEFKKFPFLEIIIPFMDIFDGLYKHFSESQNYKISFFGNNISFYRNV